MDTIVEYRRRRTSSVVESDVQSDDPFSSSKLQSLESIQCYVREFLAKPNPLLGRKGPTCPFVPKSIKLDTIYLGVVSQQHVPTEADMENVVLAMKERFKLLEPMEGSTAPFKAIILIFPDISLADAPDMIDGLQKKLKPLFVEDGLMLGEFHKFNNASGLRNSSFFPLRTPVPCMAIRHMVPSDIAFLNQSEFPIDVRKAMIERFLETFGDKKNNDDQTKMANDLLESFASEDDPTELHE